MNGFGQIPDLRCNSLSIKNNMIIDSDGKINAKNGFIRNLNVKSLTVNGSPMSGSYTFSSGPISLDYYKHMFNGPVGTPHTVTLHWFADTLPTNITIDELSPTDNSVLNSFGPFLFNSSTNTNISSVTITPTVSPSLWGYGSNNNSQVVEVHIQSQ